VSLFVHAKEPVQPQLLLACGIRHDHTATVQRGHDLDWIETEACQIAERPDGTITDNGPERVTRIFDNPESLHLGETVELSRVGRYSGEMQREKSLCPGADHPFSRLRAHPEVALANLDYSRDGVMRLPVSA